MYLDERGVFEVVSLGTSRITALGASTNNEVDEDADFHVEEIGSIGFVNDDSYTGVRLGAVAPSFHFAP